MRAELASSVSADEAAALAGRRSLLAHLDAARRHIVRAALAVAVGFLVAFTFISHIVGFILRPLQHVLPGGDRLIYTQTTDAFVLYLKIAALAGVVLASPYLLWQVWQLSTPVLSRRARRHALAFVSFSTLLFAVGALFGHYVVFPWIWGFLAGFATDYMRFAPEITAAFSLYVKVVVALGLVFEMPVVVFFLARLGIVSHRTLLHYGRHAVLVAFVIGAIVTPPDVVSQVLLAAPLLGLYGLAIGIAWLFGSGSASEG